MEDNNEEKWNEIFQLSESSLLPKLPFSFYFEQDATNENDSKCNQQSILTTKVQAGQKLVGICTLLKSISSSSITDKGIASFITVISSQRRKHLGAILSLVGEQYQYQYNSADKLPWSSERNTKLVEEIIREICRIFNLESSKAEPEPGLSPLSLSELFVQDFSTGISPNKSIFGQLLQIFRGKLVGKDDVWKYFPAAKASFQWNLYQVKYPHLSDFIPGTLQPVLNFHDDFQIQNQLDGLDCIAHIVDNVNKAELCGSGSGSWCDVIYKSLKKLLHITTDGQVITKLLPEIRKILKLLEKDPHVNSTQFTLYDEILEIVLHTIEFGSNEYKTKTLWLQELCSFLQVMGFSTLHWLVRIIRILHDNTTCNDPKRWLMVLQCVKICLINTWVKPESERFAEIILRIVYNLSVFELECDQETRNEIIQSSQDCFNLLKCNSDYESVKKHLLELAMNNMNDSGTNNGTLQPKFLEAWNSLSSDLLN